MSDWKERLGVVYSTNRDYQYQTSEEEQPETLSPEKQDLRVWLDKKHRAGKVATLIKGFVGSDDDLSDLARMLKNKCGVGGSSKDGEIQQITLHSKVKLCDVSPTAEKFGAEAKLQVGDRVHGLTDLRKQIRVLFVVDRPVDVPMYWNVVRNYNSTAKHIAKASNGFTISVRIFKRFREMFCYQ